MNAAPTGTEMKKFATNESIFGTAAPFEGERGTRLRTLFEHITRSERDAHARKNPFAQVSKAFQVPAPLHAAFKVETIKQQLPMTEIIIRYIVAHTYLSRAEAAAQNKAAGEKPSIEKPSIEESSTEENATEEDPAVGALLTISAFEGGPEEANPLEGPEGARLRQLFDHVRGLAPPQERLQFDQKTLGFEIPEPVLKAFSDCVPRGGQTELLVRYVAAHNAMSAAAS